MSEQQQKMAHVYVHSGDRFEAPVDKRKCRASVTDRDGWRSSQCARKVKVEVGGYGWCTQHSPDAIAERDKKRDARDAKQQRKWASERIGLVYLSTMEKPGDPEQAAAAAHRVWKNRQG